MIKQFVQVSAHKDSNNFAHCSNLSLMSQGKTYGQAINELNIMAFKYEQDGYEIEWITEPFTDYDFEAYSAILK